MELQGTRTLPVTQQQAWAGLNDPDILKACIPGCERFERGEGENSYDAVVALRIGPVAARFSGKVALSDIVPPTSYALNFEASAGVAGFGKGQAQVRLEPQEGGCVLHYDVHSQVGGKIAQIGQRLVDGVARNLSEEFFRKFEEALVLRHAPAADAAATDGADTTPRGGTPSWLWWCGAALALAALWLLFK